MLYYLKNKPIKAKISGTHIVNSEDIQILSIAFCWLERRANTLVKIRRYKILINSKIIIYEAEKIFAVS